MSIVNIYIRYTIQQQQMSSSIIFPDSTQFPVPLYPILTLTLSLLCYTALFSFNLQKIIEKLFTLCLGLSHTDATLVYLVLINVPMMVLSGVSLLMHRSLVGMLISSDVDYLQIVLVSAYICYIEQSRQTPIRGFLFIRDFVVMLLCIGGLANLYYDGIIILPYGIALPLLYLVYYFSQSFEQKMEDKLLRVMGIRESNAYNAQFLLTQTHKQANHLQLKNAIQQNRVEISKDIDEFKQMLDKLYSSEDQKHILFNFAKIFLAYKNALEIQEMKQVNQNIRNICEDWVDSEKSQEPEPQDEDIDGQPNQQSSGQNQSSACLMYNRTMTDDYVLEIQQQVPEQSIFNKVIRYGFYPLYWISTVEGRVRYFLDYLCVALLFVLMWLIANSCQYFVSACQGVSYGAFALVIAVMLTIPTGKYYLQISSIKDFDFVNIFLQSSILKSSVFGLLTLILYLLDSSAVVHGTPGLLFAVAVNFATYLVFGGYMVAQKFATRKSNAKVMLVISVVSYLVRIVGELVCNEIINSQQQQQQSTQ